MIVGSCNKINNTLKIFFYANNDTEQNDSVLIYKFNILFFLLFDIFINYLNTYIGLFIILLRDIQKLSFQDILYKYEYFGYNIF